MRPIIKATYLLIQTKSNRNYLKLAVIRYLYFSSLIKLKFLHLALSHTSCMRVSDTYPVVQIKLREIELKSGIWYLKLKRLDH